MNEDFNGTVVLLTVLGNQKKLFWVVETDNESIFGLVEFEQH